MNGIAMPALRLHGMQRNKVAGLQANDLAQTDLATNPLLPIFYPSKENS